MGRNKACGPDDLTIEAIMVVAEMKPELLTYILQRIMADGIPDSWKTSKRIPIFKNKGDILECNNYRGIKWMSHFMKLWERVVEARLREMVTIRENQFGLDQECQQQSQSLHCGKYKRSVEKRTKIYTWSLWT